MGQTFQFFNMKKTPIFPILISGAEHGYILDEIIWRVQIEFNGKIGISDKQIITTDNHISIGFKQKKSSQHDPFQRFINDFWWLKQTALRNLWFFQKRLLHLYILVAYYSGIPLERQITVYARGTAGNQVIIILP